MYSNIVLSGGTTMMSGFANRIFYDLGNIIDTKDQDLYKNCQVIAEGNRNIAPWIGASMVASMSSFSETFINRDRFAELGENKSSNFFEKIF